MCEILRTFRVSVNLTGSKRYPIVTDYTHTGALPAPLLFDGTFGRAVVETDEEH